MSTYTLSNDSFFWRESYIYGSSRIGVFNAEKLLVVNTTAQSSTLQANEYENIRGKRNYELSNHLGNVLAVVSDRRTGVCSGSGLVAYEAELVSATDYYAFGSPMPGRQGIQKCSTVTTTTNVNNYIAQEDFSSSSIGSFVVGSGTRSVTNPTGNMLHLDAGWPTRPLATRSVTVTASTAYTLNFDFVAKDSLLGFPHKLRCRILRPGGSTLTTEYYTTGSKSIDFSSVSAGTVTIEISSFISGSGSYTTTPYLDIDNFSVFYITTTTTTSTVCSIFDKGYRFGFNGKEKDNEINVNGGDYDFGARIYDSRIGRWLSVDPKSHNYVSFSPYCFGLNNPIYYKDPDGGDVEPTTMFQFSSFMPVFTHLMLFNSVLSKALGEVVVNPALNLKLHINNSQVPAGAIAFTSPKWTGKYDNKAKKYVLTTLDANIYFRTDACATQNDLGHAILILHEYFHVYAGQQMRKGNSDEKHEIWDDYFSLMQLAVKEYATDNKLIFDDKQIKELSLYNVGEGNTVFDNYINELASFNKTTKEVELKAYYERMHVLLDKPKGEDKPKEEDKPNEEEKPKE